MHASCMAGVPLFKSVSDRITNVALTTLHFFNEYIDYGINHRFSTFMNRRYFITNSLKIRIYLCTISTVITGALTVYSSFKIRN